MTRWQPDTQSRLIEAAQSLIEERGYEDTTVAEIAERAGLTKRTFFRHFADKREVLFSGSEELQRLWVTGVRDAPAGASPMAALMGGLDSIAAMFEPRHGFARQRAVIIADNPELQERESIKLQRLAGAVAVALTERGVGENAAVLAAHTGVTVFHVAFAHWIAQADPQAFRVLMDESLADLRAVTAA